VSAHTQYVVLGRSFPNGGGPTAAGSTEFTLTDRPQLAVAGEPGRSLDADGFGREATVGSNVDLLSARRF
jgi:hypothetical protein